MFSTILSTGVSMMNRSYFIHRCLLDKCHFAIFFIGMVAISGVASGSLVCMPGISFPFGKDITDLPNRIPLRDFGMAISRAKQLTAMVLS
jgi:hypothetical protein